MFLYSETLNAFRTRLIHMARRIAKREMGFRLVGGFAYQDGLGRGVRFPDFILCDDRQKHGFFDPSVPLIAISQSLCHEAKTQVIENVLRHELAHWMTHETGFASSPHDRHFRAVCARFGWGAEVSSARMNVVAENQAIEGDLASDALIGRVQKLLELGRSDNPHESELATLRANELIVKHHLGFVDGDASPVVFMDVVLKARRADAKVRAIARMLRSFLVYPVINRKPRGMVYLEVTGSDRTSVILAKYVAAFLDAELDRLWLATRKRTGLGGNRSKANFMQGVAEGYLKKQERICDTPDRKAALCRIDDHLEKQIGWVYGHLRHATIRLGREDTALSAGAQVGAELHIRKPLDVGNAKKLLTG